MPTKTPAPDLSQLRRDLGEGFARMFSLYGMNPLHGRIYALLLLSLRPVSLDEVAKEVGVARSSASVALRRLVYAQVVRVLPVGNDRKSFYEAVADPEEVMRGWWQRFFEPELRIFRESFSATERALSAAKGISRDERKGLSARVVRLSQFVGVWERALATLMPVREPASPPPKRVRVEFRR